MGGDPVQISPRDVLVIECHRGSQLSEIGGRPITEYQRDSLLLDLSTGGYRLDFTAHREGPAVGEFAALQGQVNSLRNELDLLGNAHQDTTDRFETLIGRQWYNVSRMRREDQCYVNNTDYPLEVAIATTAAGNYNFCLVDVFIDGEVILSRHNNNDRFSKACAVTFTVPAGSQYHVNDDGYRAGGVASWWELRAEGLQVAECD